MFNDGGLKISFRVVFIDRVFIFVISAIATREV
jgi:hypothetical protein